MVKEGRNIHKINIIKASFSMELKMVTEFMSIVSMINQLDKI
jgi:hypothetical protein